MSSRVILWSLIGLLFVGCADEERPYANPLIVKAGASSPIHCLKEAPQTMEKFIKGQLLHRQVDEFWDCTSAAVLMFKRWVRGRNQGSYSAKEVRNFLQENFLGEIRINDPLLMELMEIKKLFLGGSADRLLFRELDQTLEVFEEFRSVSLQMHPHMRVYYSSLQEKPDLGSGSGASLVPMNSLGRPSSAEFNRAVQTLRLVAGRVGAMLSRNKVDYSFTNLERLIKYSQGVFFRVFSGSEEKKLVDLVKRLKSLLVSPGMVKIQGSEWPRVSEVIADGFSWILRYNNYLNYGDWKSGAGLSQVDLLFSSVLSAVEFGINARSDRRFAGEEIRGLLREVNELFPFTGALDLPTVLLAWDVVSGKILSSLQKQEENIDLTQPKLEALRNEFSRWKDTQQFISEGFSSRQYMQATFFSGSPIHRIVSAREASGPEELLRILSKAPWPLANDDLGRVWIRRDGAIEHTIDSLTLLNLEKTFVRLLIKTYASKERARRELRGLNKAELKSAYADLKAFAVSFGLVKEDNETFYKKLLLESNLFLPRSDGNFVVSFKEGVEYLHYVLAGVKAAEYILQDIEAGIINRKSLGSHVNLLSNSRPNSLCEIKNDPELTVDVACFRARLAGQFHDYFAHIPRMVKYVQRLNHMGFEFFESALERTVRDDGYSSKPISKSEIVEMSVLIQYIETVILRFDGDDKRNPYNEKINVHEAVNNVFPVFSNNLEKALYYLENKRDVKPFFTYMLKYSVPPDPSLDPIHELRFRHWKFLPHKWEFEADRSTVSNILATLKSYSPEDDDDEEEDDEEEDDEEEDDEDSE